MLLKELVEKLNEALNREIATTIRNILEQAVVVGADQDVIRSIYRHRVSLGMGRAQFLADLIIDLFGVPVIKTDFALPPPSAQAQVKTCLKEMLERDCRQEHNEAKEYAQLGGAALAGGMLEVASAMRQFAHDRREQGGKLRRIIDFPELLADKPLQLIVNRKSFETTTAVKSKRQGRLS